MKTGDHNGRATNSAGGRDVRVPLGARGYSVLVETGALDRLGAIVANLTPGAARAFVVCDAGLPASIVGRVTTSLSTAGLRVATTAVRPSEAAKSLSTLERVLVEITRTKHERREPVVALGGGIVGDLAGFAAGVYRRGVPVIQCPTTLLAMVDASVGGKTGANLALGGPEEREGIRKNMVGVFHQPLAVVADVGVLQSLPARHLRAGLAECVKHGMLSADWGDPELLAWTESSIEKILALEPATLVELVARNVAVKAAVVGADEREEADAATGGRALLNLGHTFGHAVETIPGLSPDSDPANGPLQHGEAVALGLVAACRAAESMNPALRKLRLGDRIVSLLGRIGLPTKVAGLPSTDLVVEMMSHDKKVAGGVMRLILPAGPGKARVVENPPMSAVSAGIEAVRA